MALSFEPADGWLGDPTTLESADCPLLLQFFAPSDEVSLHALRATARAVARFGDRIRWAAVCTPLLAGGAGPARGAAVRAHLDVRAPTALDGDGALASGFGLGYLPTAVLLNPQGEPVDGIEGEAEVEGLVGWLAGHLGAPSDEPMSDPETAPPLTTLRAPTRIAVRADGWLAIADTGHHRILICDPHGRVHLAVGVGRGFADGPIDAARFDTPTGLSWDVDGLYVCDTANERVRHVDMTTGEVRTIAGNGARAGGPLVEASDATDTPLRGPRDCVRISRNLFVAMTGSHQIQLVDLLDGRIVPYAGTGERALVDGPLQAAALAGPTGLALMEEIILVVDAESAAIRAVETAGGTLHTMLGAGPDEHGLVDGPAQVARAHWPQGIAPTTYESVVFSDTFNDRLRRVDGRTGAVTTFFRGEADRALAGPTGLATRGDGTFVVADTGNHRLVHLSAGGDWLGVFRLLPGDAPVPADGALYAPKQPAHSPAAAEPNPDAPRVTLTPGPAELRFELVPPPGWRVPSDGPFRLRVRGDAAIAPEHPIRDTLDTIMVGAMVHATEDGRIGEVSLELTAELEAEDGDRRIRVERAWSFPLRVHEFGREAATFTLRLDPPGSAD